MNELILLKSGEVALKGLNRSTFENIMLKNAKRSLHGVGDFKFYKAQSTLYAEPTGPCDLDEAVLRLSRVFGFSALCRAGIVPKDFEQIKPMAARYLHDALMDAKTFKVNAKRADKKFPMRSPEICTELGHYLLTRFPHLRVDVHEPDLTVTVEVRDFAAYIHSNQLPGAGGMPVGSGGNAMLLLSGGIDSPVAGWMMARRGVKIHAVHFHSPPYTGERALLKVKTLCEKMSHWCGRTQLHTVGFTELQQAIHDHCPEDLSTLVMRRQMMMIAESIARESECGALITGESLGQVASQTMMALACTEAATALPVLRPAIGMDKEEIVRIARRIDTFETSILPYDDCCTVFTPRHPRTKPRLDELHQAEERVDFASLRARALESVTSETIG